MSSEKTDQQGLNPAQREAAAHRGGPLLVLAGAGTGKTRVIVHRIASLIRDGVSPGRILAVTFTNKAAGEMRERIEALVPGEASRIWAHTFHAFCARVLRRHAASIKLTPRFTVFDQSDQKRIVAECLKELGLAAEKSKAGLFVSVISRAKDELLDAKSYAIHAMTQQDPFRETVSRVYGLYQKKLDAAGGVDFGDLLLKTAELFREDKEARSYYQNLFEQILVDEYQDTNHAQYILTKTLAAGHRNICAVGDPDQSIYKFRGASIRNILEFENDFKDVKVVKLEENYRSTPNILSAASAVIANNRRRHAKSLWTKNAEGEPVESEELDDERDEARWVVRRVVESVDRGASLRDIAVFYRTNAQSRSFEEALTQAQLPYRVVGAVRFYERREVKDVLAYMRAALNESDDVSLGRVLNVPARGLGKAAEAALKDHAAREGITLREALKRPESVPKLSPAARRGARELHHLLETLTRDADELPPGRAARSFLSRTGYWDMIESAVDTDPEASGRLGNLQELANALQEFEERGTEAEPSRLERFLEDVALQSGADGYNSSAPAVTLMTVHLAKGLEFPVVCVTGLEEGLFPISAANSEPDELEEERRLCYVAMTRAKKRLFLSYAATRRLFGRIYSNLPSRFILEARIGGFRTASGGERSAPVPAPAPDPGGVPAPRETRVMKIRTGMRIQHPEFGYGRIVEKSGSGESLKLTILFDNGKSKKLLARYAPLIPVP